MSSLCFFNALKYLPLAEATAIDYATPMLVILLRSAFLKERMTLPRWAFVIAGFVGTMLIVRPGAAIFHGAALLALGRRRVLRDVPDHDAKADRRRPARARCSIRRCAGRW